MLNHTKNVIFFLISFSGNKEPRLSISNVFSVLSSDTICQLNQLFSNSEVAMLSMTEVLTVGNAESVIESNQSKLSESQN